jgi:hypothetical protein
MAGLHNPSATISIYKYQVQFTKQATTWRRTVCISGGYDKHAMNKQQRMKQTQLLTLTATPLLTFTTSEFLRQTLISHNTSRGVATTVSYIRACLQSGRLFQIPTADGKHGVTAYLLNLDTTLYGIAVWFIYEVRSRPGLFIIHRRFEHTTDFTKRVTTSGLQSEHVRVCTMFELKTKAIIKMSHCGNFQVLIVNLLRG